MSGAPRSAPRFEAADCARTRVRGASCAECALACPVGALMPTEDGITIDQDLCTGCGQCQGACPSGALGRVATPSVRQGRVTLRCSRVPGATIGCVHALGMEDLARLALEGAQEITTTTEDCATCDECPEYPLAERVAAMAQLQRLRGLAPISLRAAPGAPVDDIPDMRRRGLFRAMARPVDPPAEAPALQRLQQCGDEAPAFFATHIAASRCTGCHACARVCDTGAMILVKDQDAQLSYRNDATACTGCRLCEDVCDDNAISIHPVSGAPPPLRLRAFRCRVCGVDSARPLDQPAQDLCRICQQAPHARGLFHVLEP